MEAWRDGQTLPEIHWWVRNFLEGKHPLKDNLLDAITGRLVSILASGIAPDELINIVKSVQGYMDNHAPACLDDAIAEAVHYEFWDTEDAIDHLGSERELSEHLEYLDTLAALTGEDAERAKEIVLEKLSELEEPEYGEHRPSFAGRTSTTAEEFGDEAMRSLFLSLLR
ncbi:hypothetical protein F4X33_06530 [Candidatus Poribacteria bacterium]|nr:hypothetical protein [Candidatus Poribacteria bacterium]